MNFQNQDDNEDSRIFDEFVGDQIPESKEECDRELLQVVVDQSKELEAMRSSKGWQILSQFINSQVDWMTRQLKVETDMEKVRRLQSEILAFESLENILTKSFTDAEEARRLLSINLQ